MRCGTYKVREREDRRTVYGIYVTLDGTPPGRCGAAWTARAQSEAQRDRERPSPRPQRARCRTRSGEPAAKIKAGTSAQMTWEMSRSAQARTAGAAGTRHTGLRGSKHENQIQNHFQLKIKNETGSLLTTVQNTVYTGVPNALVYTGPGQRSAHCLFMGWALVPFSLPKRDRDCRLLDELLRLPGDER